MKFANPGAQIFVPDGAEPDAALQRSTHLAIGAHPDDIPIMAFDGIGRCFGKSDSWFLGITVTDGAGSPRSGPFSDHSDAEMRAVRIAEEKKAATIGEYSAAVLLDYPSSAVKDGRHDSVVNELAALINGARPEVVYTHNLADKHDTHVAVALRTLAAIRRLPNNTRPAAVYGCEVWRDLDWMLDADKVVFDVSDHQSLAQALIAVYDSQIRGGKRYDLAAAGRRLAHATFSESHQVDTAKASTYAMDLTPLTADSGDVATYVSDHIWRLEEDVSDRIDRLS
ncbi:MAG: PIG-L family deacetylase [Acidimicrobiia bacterium]|nr:PIG-L family deacetylase [Acidimicrobiia bacterium]